MKKIIYALVLPFIFLSATTAQEETMSPSRISGAAYFDVTPRLTDMPVVLPGERDRSWKDGLVESNYIKEVEMPEQTGLPEDFTDPVLQKYPGNRSTRGPILNFEGVGNVNNVYPPDTEGDVGPNHYFQMVNLSFAIYTKDGVLMYGPVDNSTLWDGFIGSWTGTNDGDPVVLYDHLADRWLASQFAVNTSDGTYWQLIAISTTPDPMGSWYRYAYEFDDMNDYPKISVWPDGYYATFRMFGTNVRGGAAAFERDKMLAGDPSAQMVYFDMPSNTLEVLPADVDGPVPPEDSPCYFVNMNMQVQKLKVYAFNVNWQTPSSSSISLQVLLTVDPFSYNLDGITQPGTSQKLDEMIDRLMYRLQYRNFGDYEAMVTNHTVNVSGHAGIRWYELRREGGGWYVYQQGTYSPDTENRWMGSIAMNSNGEMALGFSVSSSTTYPSIRYTGRTADAPLGEMNIEEFEVVAGTSAQSGVNRWGDYSMMAVDPADDVTFWYTQEYMKGAWRTRINSFDFGPLLPPVALAGNDTVLCENKPFMTQGAARHTASVLWSSSGNGNFIPTPPTSLSVIYLRSNQDIANGSVTLTLTANGYGEGWQDTDEMVLFLQKLPAAFAGNDTLICVNHILTLSGEADYCSAVEWTTNGDGTFDNPTLLNATYTPGPQDITNLSVKLTLTALSMDPCDEDDSDQMKVTLDPCTGIEDPVSQAIALQIVPNPGTGLFDVFVKGSREQVFDLQVLDGSGQVIFTQRGIIASDDLLKKLNLTYHPRGVYFVKVQTGHRTQVEKLILN